MIKGAVIFRKLGCFAHWTDPKFSKWFKKTQWKEKLGCHLTHLHANHSSIFIPSPPISFTHSNPRPSSSLEPLQSSLEPFSRSSLLAAATLLRSVRTIRGRRERETHRDRETRERTSAFHLFSFVFFSAGSTARGIPLLLRVPLEATAFHLFAFVFFSAGSTGGNWIALPLKAGIFYRSISCLISYNLFEFHLNHFTMGVNQFHLNQFTMGGNWIALPYWSISFESIYNGCESIYNLFESI